MSAHLYIEGGESKEDQIRCREAFRRIFEKLGLSQKLPRLTASGGRGSAFDDFKTAHAGARGGDFVAMLVDSEDPLADLELTWAHLKRRDNWDRPNKAVDEQVLFMTTCMEAWIVADRAALREHYGHRLQESALPPVVDLENRSRHDLHENLAHASRDCSNAYSKGKRSFEVLAKVDAAVLKQHLPSFVRVDRILKEKL